VATIRHFEGAFRLPALRLRAGRGQVVCLLRPQASATRGDGVCLLALIASRRTPFLRCLRLYRRHEVLLPTGAPSAA
jgi:hypothetical protein